MEKENTTHTTEGKEGLRVGDKVKHKFIKELLTIAPDEAGPAYTGKEFKDNEISLSHAQNEFANGNLEIVKEGLHTQGEWMTNDISRDRTAIEIITDKPNGQNSNGYIATIECDLYTVPGQARANADIICQAVNERKALLDSHKQLLQALKDIFQYDQENTWVGRTALKAINNAKNIK